jgi:glycosyltransferase involved in cell wall biosynthesis
VEKYRCGISVDPDQPQQIADAIVYLLEHPQEAREMGRRGRAVIEESWNWAHEFPKLEGLYDKLIASDQKKAGAERPKDE